MPRKKPAAKLSVVEEPEVEKESVKDGPTDGLNLRALRDFDIEEILENFSNLGPNAVPALRVLYDEVMADIRPLLKMTPEIVGMVGKDVSPLLAAILVTINEIVSADEMQAALAVTREIKAENRWKALAAYMEAGFNRDEALALVLQDTASAQSMVSMAVRTMGKSHK